MHTLEDIALTCVADALLSCAADASRQSRGASHDK